ncbi:hypothetical protein MUK42_33047 [Musa troglodytarum]|uniref:Uncharacterized protein n=1 Tax=Musa troglodytarum TaxID=320322 RepID=A0A9E7IJM4_9LILI|nr:hypothetical protein MUK42_33047 [Musa troglodytarum]URE47838.1 hypothetical protein MUK42_33047 [Musa troglodytarum]URE47839.1 hypothetical protein MUK42_33047 [Musa troglodytarum]
MLANRVPAMATPDSIASMKRAKNDDVSSELLVPVAPRPIPSYQNKGVPPESLFLTKDLLQCLEHERVYPDLPPKLLSHLSVGPVDALVHAVHDDVNSFFRDHVNPLEDVADVIARRDVVGVVGEEFHLFDHFGEPLRYRRPPGFVGAAEQILDDVGMYSLVGDPVPRSSEVADVAGAAVEEADALGVNHVEGPAGGVLGLELLPRQPLVEVTSRGGRGLVEAHGAVVVAGEGGV